MAESVQAAWTEYQDSRQRALAALNAPQLEDADQPVDESGLAQLDVHSDALRIAIADGLNSDDSGTRQLAMLQLQAAAIQDLDLASRLASQEISSGLVSLEEGGRPETLSEADLAGLDAILATPQHLGISAVVDYRSAALESVDPAVFKETVSQAITRIVTDGSTVAAKMLSGLLELPGSAILDAVDKTVGLIFGEVGDKVRRLVKWAVKLVLRAIEKLLSIFGSSADAARAKVGEWIKGLDETKIDDLLSKLFGVEAIKARIDTEIDARGAAAAAAGKLDPCSEQVGQLAARLHKQMEVLDKLAWVVDKAQGWLVTLAPPWGAAGVAAGYVVASGYAVFATEDYLDVREGGLLDLVPGVQHSVDGALA